MKKKTVKSKAKSNKKAVNKSQQFEVVIKDISGIAVKVFRPTKFKKYIGKNVNGNYIISPVYDKFAITKAYKKTINLKSKQLLDSLYGLYLDLNYEKPKQSHIDLIIKWCKDNVHPYNLIEVANIVNDTNIDSVMKSSLLDMNASFKYTDFVDDLVSIGKTYELYNAYYDIINGNYETAFNLYRIGKYCEASSIFEKYKYVDKYYNFDYEEAKNNVKLSKADLDYLSHLNESDIVYKMIIDSAYQRQLVKKDKEKTELQKNSIFKYKPEKAIIEYFKEHVKKDIDNIKLKICEQFDSMHFEVQPSKNGFQYVINLYSVFDYCWNTLSSMATINEKPVANDIDNESRENIRKICIKCGNRFYTSARNALRCPKCRLEEKRERDKVHKREKRSKEHKNANLKKIEKIYKK